LRHPKEFCHGVDGGGRAPAANLVVVRVAGRSNDEVIYTWRGSIMVMLQLYTTFNCRKVVGVGQPELVEGFRIAVCRDELGSGIVACANPATWPGVVDIDLVAV
jgi:hypothetical protein